ncbi:MAG: hypothetical protein Q9183_000597 [Haloplaca sp. 2 TL-2023]
MAARARVSAPAPVIFSILRSTTEYASWNTFVPKVVIHQQPQPIPAEDTLLHVGTSFTFHVVMDSSKPTKVTDTQCRITDISTPEDPSGYVPEDVLREDGSYAKDLGHVWRIAWTTEGGFVARGLRTERFNEVIELGDGEGCEIRTWENQSGVLARAVKWSYKDVLNKKFEGWCKELKKEAEKRVGKS